MPDYLLDTNAFNRSLDLNIDPSTITRRGAVFVTHIQVNELECYQTHRSTARSFRDSSED